MKIVINEEKIERVFETSWDKDTHLIINFYSKK